MPGPDFGTGKSIVVLAVVVGCFAILWPKIFYPMMQAAFTMTAPNMESEERAYRPRDRPPHLSPDMMAPPPAPHLHEGGQVEKEFIKEGRPFPHPSSRQPVKPQAKTGGAMSIIMPVYTIGIVVFFLYTVLKLVFKKSPETDKKPLIKDFHMDPDYHKFVCQQTPKEKEKPKPASKSKFTVPESANTETTNDSPENFDEKDYEIFKLRKKLEETESAMERIMKHMGAVSECLSNACLLKDCSGGGNGNKNIALETLLPESLTEVFRKKSSPIKIGKNKGKSKNHDKKESDDEVEKPMDIFSPDSTVPTEDLISGASPKDCCNLETPLQKELKRDSSINSETSSFELLSHSLISNSSELADTNSSDSDAEQPPKKCENESDECAKIDAEKPVTDDDEDDQEDEDDDDESSEESEEHEFSNEEGHPCEKSQSK